MTLSRENLSEKHRVSFNLSVIAALILFPSEITAAQKKEDEIRFFNAGIENSKIYEYNIERSINRKSTSDVSDNKNMQSTQSNIFNALKNEANYAYDKSRVFSTPVIINKSENKFTIASEDLIRNFLYQSSLAALKNSALLKSLLSEKDKARAHINEAKGQRWPQIELSSNTPSLKFGAGDKSKYDNTPLLAMKMQTTIYDFGENTSTIESRKYIFDAAEHDLEAQGDDLTFQVSSLITEFTKQKLVVSVSEEYIQRIAELVKMLNEITEADPGRRSELTQAKAKLLQAQSSLNLATAKVRDSEVSLSKLMGSEKIHIPIFQQWDLQPTSTQRLLNLVESHPAVKKSRAEAASAITKIDAIKSSSKPKVNWTVSKSMGEDQYGRQQSWHTGININWKIFDGGSSRAAEMVASYQSESNLEMANQKLIDYQYRVRAADQEARAMLERASLYNELNADTDIVRHDFFDQWYHLGKRSLLDVLTAESEFYNNRINEITSRFDAYNAILRGYASAGKLFKWLENGSV